jgi:hypothetical protein
MDAFQWKAFAVDDQQLSGVTGIFHHAILAKRNLDEVGCPSSTNC